MADLLEDTHILSGPESQRLRTFCSSVVIHSSDLDSYARLLQIGPLSTIKADFNDRVSTSSLEIARATLAAITYGPGKIPLYNYLLQLMHLNPPSRSLYISAIKFLAEDAKVPVDNPDASGTTALMWCLSTKPYFEPEIAQILLSAGGNINHRNRYGCVAAHDAVMARDFSFQGKRKTCAAVKFFVERGGDLDVECGDGTTPRGIAGKVQRLVPELGRLAKGAAKVEGAACGACGLRGGKLLTCGKCGVRRYCDRTCQVNEWKVHRKSCGGVKK